MKGRPYIVVDRVCKSFGPQPVLREVSTQFRTGEVSVIIGASGSGKSTLLRAINRLEPHDSGSITIDGVSVGSDEATLQRQRIAVGMVFQQFNLFGHMTVLDNLTLAPRRIHKTPRGEANVQAMALLRRVGLQEHAARYPWQLSGGQQQRVAIARALAMQPEIMLFDEATSALDPELVGEVLNVMRELATEGMTMVIVTHEIAFAREVADRVVFLRDGVIVEDGPAKQVIDAPQQEATQAFLSHFHRQRDN